MVVKVGRSQSIRQDGDSVHMRLEESGEEDVVLDGVSLVSNYRSQFNSIIRTSSLTELMTRLRNKQIEAHVVPRIGRGGS